MVKIEDVLNNSLSEKCGIKKGDILLSINNYNINDVLDYRFYLAEKSVCLEIKRGEEIIKFQIEKNTYDDIGLEFETPLMDKKHRCENKCIFCFIDQLPKGMRESLYFKDDDSRLSFLHGNYITLTNLEEKDIKRIIEMHITPVNISVHTTNPELRCKMMHNKRAGDVLRYINILTQGGIDICGQVVLCKNINDGLELEKTLHDLASYYPRIKSVAIVPFGMTKYRENLYPIEQFNKEDCEKIINQVEEINEYYYKKYGKSLFFCSDEFYLSAKRELPKDEYYEDYSQIENGVGMLRSFECEVEGFLKTLSKEERKIKRTISIATGVASYDFICNLVSKIQKKCKGIQCNVYKIINDFFGHTITVSGLITGVDLINQLSGKELGNELLISRNMLRAEGDLFLCGTSLGELISALKTNVRVTDTDGVSFTEAVLGL